MNIARKFLRLLLIGSFGMIACSRAPERPSGISSFPRELMPIGHLMNEPITFQFAIFFLPRPASDPIAELDRLLTEQPTALRRIDKLVDKTEAPVLVARVEQIPMEAHAPPDMEYLRYFGRGLTREQAESLQQTEAALILDFAYAKEHVWTGMRTALDLTNKVAEGTGGLIWDDSTREMFTHEAWQERRIANWTQPVPDISTHTVVHAYQKGESARAITLGMAKFGLPDVVVDGFPWSVNRNVGHIINLFAQAMAEGAVVQKAGEFDLDIRAIKNPEVREPQVTTLKSNATGVALLTLSKGRAEEGDPSNRLIEITFDRGAGPDMQAKQLQVLAAAFGWEDSVTPVQHDEELLAASQRARAKLPALRAEFENGLAPGDFILVKAPFPTPKGEQEWMWVEVASWKGSKITGLLQNEPYNIPHLHTGQNVEVSETDVFDYIRKSADGATEGNETGRLMERRSNSASPANE